MRDINDLIEKNDKYKTVLLQKRFDSKKNTVAYVLSQGHPRVLKWFVPGLKQNMQTEYSVLIKAHSKLTVPLPYEKDEKNNVLVMSYIVGKNVCDLINDTMLTFEEKQRIIQMIANWFISFHELFQTKEGFRIRGDATLKNFLHSKNQIWGVDFEESRPGKPSEDLATFCVSLLTTDPMFTSEKFQLCQSFLEAYRKSSRWTIEAMNAEISYAMLERIQWRPKDESLLRQYAMNIRSRGLQAAHQQFLVQQ
jgi:tRNA A-37 threonylcarbamoyl transferase component Bud32